MTKIYDIYGNVLYESKADTIKEAVEEAVRKDILLENANLNFTDLRGANLYYANIRKASMKECRLEGANLYCAKLLETDLTGSPLDGANLYCASFWKSYLPFTEFEGANMRGTDFEGAEFESKLLKT